MSSLLRSRARAWTTASRTVKLSCPGNGKPQDSSFLTNPLCLPCIAALSKLFTPVLAHSFEIFMDGAVGHLFPALCSAAQCALLSDIPRELGIPHSRVIYTREICKHYKPDLFLSGNKTLNRCQCATVFEVQKRWGRKDG